MRLYRRLLGYAWCYRRTFLAAIAAMIGLASTEWVMPYLLSKLIDEYFGRPLDAAALAMPAALIALFVVRGVLSYIGNIGLAWVANRVVMDFREKMFHRVVHLPVGYFSAHAAGSLVSKFTFDATQVSTAVTKVVNDLVKDSAVIIVLVIWLAYLNARLALVVTLVVPPIALVIRAVSRRMREMSRRLQTAIGGINRVAEEAVLGHREIRMNGTAEKESARFHEVINAARQNQMKVLGTAMANVPLIQLFVVTGIATMMTVALYEGAQGAMTRGEFVAFVTATLLLVAPARRLTGVNEHLQRGLAAAESLFDLIDEPLEPDEGDRALPEGPLGIALDNVRFRYPERASPALDGVCLTVAPGETVAIVGASGSGKSTLIDLIPRFYVVEDGVVRVGGIDVRELSLATLRSRIAVVGQNVVLFNDSIRYNIGYGVHDTDEAARNARIEAAADAAQVSGFCADLPEGLDTQIGDRGVRLSGGQRQRIALARALAKDASILLLDEATSALDSATERAIKAALDAIHGSRTLVIVAHRLTTVESADRIIVLDAGRVVETGAHRELLARGGAYAALHHTLERDSAAPVVADRRPAARSGAREALKKS